LILHNLIFKNRKEAFKMLYDVLPTEDMRQEHWILLATYAGGVPIAIEIAKKLNADFDFLFT